MSTLTQFQQNRRVIQDFTQTTLAGIPGLFARLAYMASLRDLSSGRYEHAGLAALYPDASIQQALQLCHEQIFERILEEPLSSQEQDLRACLAAMDGGMSVAVSDRKSTRLNSSHFRISYAVFCLKKKKRPHGRGRTRWKQRGECRSTRGGVRE